MPTQSTAPDQSAPTPLIRQRRYANLTDNTGQDLDGTWADTVEFYSSHARRAEKGGPLHNYAELRQGTTRGNRNVVRVHAFVGDIDHRDRDTFITSLREIKAAGVAAVISSTWSHTPETPCLRIVLKLSRPVCGYEYATLWDATNTRLKLHADTQSRDPAHLFYDPIAPEGAKTFVWSQEGVPLDVDAILRDAPPVQRATARTGLEWAEQVEAIPSGARDATLAALAGKLFASDLPAELGYGLLHAVNEARCKPPLPTQQVDKIAKSIARAQARGQL